MSLPAASAAAAALQQLDWTRPCFAPLLPCWQQWQPALREHGALPAALSAAAAQAALRNAAGLPLHFIEQQALPAGVAYESHIFATAGVPTRDNLHDLLNALIWFCLPHSKAVLNRIQAAQIAQHGVGAVRGSLRDRATLFDENAAVLCLRDDARGHALHAALRAHDWDMLFAAPELAAGLHLFGHALLEKLLTPFKAITAHCFVLYADQIPPPGAWDRLDPLLAARLAAGDLQQERVFCPLPLAGVRGWWPQQDAAFYADQTVFRPPRNKCQLA